MTIANITIEFGWYGLGAGLDPIPNISLLVLRLSCGSKSLLDWINRLQTELKKARDELKRHD